MCGPGSPPKDDSAEVAREQEQQRQNRIKVGKEAIDQHFSIFNPEYYDKFKADYEDVYNPQVDEQFTDARQDLRYNLARAGTQDSTPGQKAFGDLTEAYGDQRRAVTSKAIEATNNIKGQVESNKSDLYGQNNASADPSLTAISAVGRAGSLQSPPSFSPLADLFAGAANAGAAYMSGSNRSLPAGYRGAIGAGMPSASGGSGYVVGR